MSSEAMKDVFLVSLIKYLDTSVEIKRKALFKTVCGDLDVDFALSYGPGKIGIFLDLDINSEEREWEIAALLGSGSLDTVYELRSKYLRDHLEDCIFVIARMNPEFFSPRGITNIFNLASKEARGYTYEVTVQVGDLVT